MVRFDARNRIAELPASPDPARSGAESADSSEPRDSGSDVRPLELIDPEPAPGGSRRLRLDFYAAGGGTVLAVCAWQQPGGQPRPVRRLRRHAALSARHCRGEHAELCPLIKRQAEALTRQPRVVLRHLDPPTTGAALARPGGSSAQAATAACAISASFCAANCLAGSCSMRRVRPRWPETMPIGQ